MITDPTFYILAAIAVVIVGISESGFGSGIGVLGVPLMALVIPPAQAAAIMLPLLCVMDIFNVFHYRSRFDRTNLIILIPAALVGILLGTFTFRYLTDAHIRILLGVISILFVINFFIGRRNGDKKRNPIESKVVSGGQLRVSPVLVCMPAVHRSISTCCLKSWIKPSLLVPRLSSSRSLTMSN